MSRMARPGPSPAAGLGPCPLPSCRPATTACAAARPELADLLPSWHPRGSRAHWNGRALRQERVRLAKELAIVARASAAMSSPD